MTVDVKSVMDSEKTILFYDGHCLMCSSLVQWVLKKDTAGKIHFAALQDVNFTEFLKQAPAAIRDADSVILFHNERFYHYSSAIIKLYALFGFPWSAMVVFKIVPVFIRDAVYRLIARYRKKWFGSSESCFLVSPEKRARFLSDPTDRQSKKD